MSKSIRVGILGLGTVGTGVVRILEGNASLIERRIGSPLEVKRVAVQDLGKERGLTLPDGVLTADPFEVVRDPDVDIVVELIGGEELARELALAALAGGKHLVTANKALLAEHGEEIRRAAREAGVNLGFEASVAGGIPVIKTIREALAANRVLSHLRHHQRDLELHPHDDAGRGKDRSMRFSRKLRDSAMRKPIRRLTSVASMQPTSSRFSSIWLSVSLQNSATSYTEGITRISPIDIDFGREFGYTLKLLAIAKATDEGIEARVHPTMVPDAHPIAQVGGVYNAIEIVGDAVGDLMLYGKGAGGTPTASAVVSDIMDISREMGPSEAAPSPSLLPPDGSEGSIKSIESISSLYYLRFMVDDQPGVLSDISGILGRHNISIESVIQKGRETRGPVPLVVMTHMALERDVQDALSEIDELSCVSEKAVLIRVEAEKN